MRLDLTNLGINKYYNKWNLVIFSPWNRGIMSLNKNIKETGRKG